MNAVDFSDYSPEMPNMFGKFVFVLRDSLLSAFILIKFGPFCASSSSFFL